MPTMADTVRKLKKANAACRAAERRYAAAERLAAQCYHSAAYNAACELRRILRAEADAASAAFMAICTE